MLPLLAAAVLVCAAAPSESDPLLRQLAETRNFNLGRPMAVRITPDEETVLFLRSPPTSGVLSLLAFDLRQVGPERFWTSIVRPRNFKPGVKLPVIVEIYGAAHPRVQQSMGMNLTAQWMADHGFLVVKLDGRGTTLRDRAWERKIKFDFAGAIDDQIAALRALAAEVPELDLTRVGIEGVG